MTRRLASFTIALTVMAGAALAQMPDLRQMAGQPLPSGDLPVGAVSVRVVRGGLSNNVSGVEVELVASGDGSATAARVTTDQNGRAAFSGLPAGAAFRAVVTVDGERLVSQPFTVPATGGLRILLAAGLGSAPGAGAGAATAVPAAPGSVTLGGQSRMVLELAEGSIEVFCLLDILNPASGPVAMPSPLTLELPDGAANASTLEGSTPLAKVEGARVVVRGPLPAGTTSLHFAYRVPTGGRTLALRQVLPLAAPQATVIVRKFGDLSVSLAGERGRREVPIEGRTYFVLNGGAVPAGGAVDVTLSGLPAHARWPRYVALGLAGLVLLAGVGLAMRTQGHPEDDVRRLHAERAARFDELVALERRLVKKAAASGESLDRRRQLIDEIAELDLGLEALRLDAPQPPEAGSSETVAAGARASAAQ